MSKLLSCKWDGSYLGPIDDSIHKIIDKNRLCIWTLNSKNQQKLVEVKYFKFKNEIPLISDEIKKLFDIPQIGMHVISYKDNPYIMTRSHNDVSLLEYFTHVKRSELSSLFINEMRRLFAFRWILCLNSNYENKIEVRIDGDLHYPISYSESKYSFITTENGCRIPQTILKDWFDGSNELLDTHIRSLLENKNPDDLKCKIRDIINKYSNKYVSWVNSIYDRIIHSMY